MYIIAAEVSLRRSFMDCDEAVMRLLSGAALDDMDEDRLGDDGMPPLIGGAFGGGALDDGGGLD